MRTVFALELKQHLAALLGAHHAGEVGDQHCAVRLAVVLRAKVQQLRVRHHQVPRLRLARAAKLGDDAREQRDRLAGRALRRVLEPNVPDRLVVDDTRHGEGEGRVGSSWGVELEITGAERKGPAAQARACTVL